MVTLMRVGWGQENPAFRQMFTTQFVPGATKEQADWFNELQRISSSSADAARNLEFLRPFLKGEAPVSYAYPYGKASLRTKGFLAPRFSSLRGVHPGLNIGRVDLAQLNTISLEARCWDQDKIEAAIHLALHEHAWLIFYTHDVSETPSEYGSTPGMLDWALSRVAAARIEVLPMKEALPVALGA